jgi:hypothetical protein
MRFEWAWRQKTWPELLRADLQWREPQRWDPEPLDQYSLALNSPELQSAEQC